MSEVITDKLTGRATAGDVTITAGSATMQLQQGVVKARGECDASGTTRNTSSLNVSSFTDNGTNGKQFNFSNNFDAIPIAAGGAVYNANEGGIGGAFHDEHSLLYFNSRTTGHFSVRYYDGANYVDQGALFTAHGDLA